MTRVQAKRLLKLAAFLRKVPKKKFEMSSFAGKIGDTHCQFESVPAVGECGTTACAAGWATTMPSFKRLGLAMRLNEYNRPVVCQKQEPTHNEIYALAGIFGPDAAYLMCRPLEHPEIGDGTPRAVANAFKALVKRHYPDLAR